MPIHEITFQRNRLYYPIKEKGYGLHPTLSQKQLGKYLSLEIFPASMGRVPVLFQKISIKQHPRNKYL